MEYPQVRQGKIYLVGGNVRDTLLKRKSKDVDFVLVGSTEEQARIDFSDWIYVGKMFPVFRKWFGDIQVDVALARTEKRVGRKHIDFVAYTKDVSLEDDLLRRDLTINSMAMDINGTIIDPFNGRKDLENKVLRHTSKAFEEDPLRVYRVARFAAQLGFYVHPDTIILMKDMSNYLGYLTKDRIREELLAACKGEYPSKFMEVLEMTECKDRHFCCPIISGRTKRYIRKFKNARLPELYILGLLYVSNTVCSRCQSIFTNDMRDFLTLFGMLGNSFKDIKFIMYLIEFCQRKFNIITTEHLTTMLETLGKRSDSHIYKLSKELYESVKANQFDLEGRELGDAIRNERIRRIGNVVDSMYK